MTPVKSKSFTAPIPLSSKKTSPFSFPIFISSTFTPQLQLLQRKVTSPALIKPTFDVSDYGHDLIIPLNCLTGSATTTLTPSTATFVQVLEDSRVPVDEVNQFITDSDKNGACSCRE